MSYKVKAMAGESGLVFRTFERCDDKGVWHSVEAEQLVKGDVFRAYEPGGSAMPGMWRVLVPFYPVDDKSEPLQPSGVHALTNWMADVEPITGEELAKYGTR